MSYPRHAEQAGEEVLAGYLAQARTLLAGRPAVLEDGSTGLGPDFEALRWFPLPPACLGRGERSVRPADHAEHPHVDLAKSPQLPRD